MQQRRRAGDEQAHVRARLARQRGLGQHAHVQRGHAHEHGGLAACARSSARGVELLEPDHLAAVEQRAVERDEQAVHVEDRQRVDQHVAVGCQPQYRFSTCAFDEQVAVREHRALAAPGRAAGVEDGGQVVGAPLHGTCARRSCSAARSSSVPLRSSSSVKTFFVPALNASLLTQPKLLAWAHHHRRLGVADEVVDLGRLVGGVQRQVDMAGAQHGQVQHQRFDDSFGLHRDARRRRAARASRAGWRCIARGAVEVAPGVEQRRGVSAVSIAVASRSAGKAARSAAKRLWLRSSCSCSVQLRARALHHLGPALDLGARRTCRSRRRTGWASRCPGRSRWPCSSSPSSALLHLGLHRVDDFLRRALGRPQAVPGGDLVGRHAGRPGQSARRRSPARACRPATAMALMRPPLMCVADEPRPSNIMSTWPAIRSCSAGPAPRYGMWVMKVLVCSLNSSPARWCEVPLPAEP